MQDFNYNIIDNIINRKMKRLNQITQSIEIRIVTKSYFIKELMELSQEIEDLSSSLMPYFKSANIGAG